MLDAKVAQYLLETVDPNPIPFLKESPAPPERKRPMMLIIAGPNGSGKTSLTTQLRKHRWDEGCAYINPDNIARDEFGDWNSPEAVYKAALRAESIRETCLSEGRSFMFETVLSAPDKVEFVNRAHEAGYFIRLFFIGTDRPQINAYRIAGRVMDGGHDVPIPKIISRYGRSIENCARLSGVIDRLYVYDNSVENASPVLLFRADGGHLLKQYDNSHEWADLIFRILS
jgi:predicted ABC-type ATPase